MARALAPGATVTLEFTVTNTGDISGTQDITLEASNGTTQTVDQVTGLTVDNGNTSSPLTLTWDIPSDKALGSYTLSVNSNDASDSIGITLREPDTVALAEAEADFFFPLDEGSGTTVNETITDSQLLFTQDPTSWVSGSQFVRGTALDIPLTSTEDQGILFDNPVTSTDITLFTINTVSQTDGFADIITIRDMGIRTRSTSTEFQIKANTDGSLVSGVSGTGVDTPDSNAVYVFVARRSGTDYTFNIYNPDGSEVGSSTGTTTNGAAFEIDDIALTSDRVAHTADTSLIITREITDQEIQELISNLLQ